MAPRKKKTANGIAKDEKARAAAENGAPKDAVVRRRFTQNLPCDVDPVEKAKLADQLAAVIGHRLAKQDERREAMAGFNEEITGLNERERELAEAVRTSAVMRAVECVERLLPDNRVEIIRVDLGTVVETRAAAAEDLQEDMFAGDDEDYDDGSLELPEAEAPAP